MTNFIDSDDVRGINPSILNTDGITDAQIDTIITREQIFILNDLAIVYNPDEITISNAPDAVLAALKLRCAGQVIIDFLTGNKTGYEIGKDYKKDSEKLIKNIVDGKRRFASLAKQSNTGTVANSIVYEESSVIQTIADGVIDDIDNGYYDY